MTRKFCLHLETQLLFVKKERLNDEAIKQWKLQVTLHLHEGRLNHGEKMDL